MPPLRCGTRARIVDSYVYFGSVVSADNSVVPDSARRSQKAMVTFAPLSLCLFGSARMARGLQLSLASSLHAVAAWTECPRRAYTNLNVTYMRVLRRITGKPRYDRASAATSDREVGEELRAPSLQSLLARRRLQLLASALNADSPILSARLATEVRGARHGALPWLELVLVDMEACRLL